ncbi:MAG: hypothetical protein JWO05_1989 [Gemmatimonadetes bacterium]|nr:hypothetical protein [Gemmatimonadota bacterium]
MMTSPGAPSILSTLDDPTRLLVQLAAVVTVGDEPEIRDWLGRVVGVVPDTWVEELVLQTYLFAGFPRSLNAMREWRKLRPMRVSPDEASSRPQGRDEWRVQGEETCGAVYGRFYDALRVNIRGLHPALDDWMVEEGYGKVLSREGLDLPRRELCIIAACVAGGQDRQLHSHLHGAVNVGVAPAVVSEALEAIAPVVLESRLITARLLWARVRGK